MACAYLLHAQESVTLYEQNAMLGGHTRTLQVQQQEKSIPVDTGFIVYNERNYPHLTAMFRHLGVQTQKSCMTFGITIDDGRIEWGAENLNAVFGQRSNLVNPGFYRMLLDMFRFNRGAVACVKASDDITLGELLRKMRLGEAFLNYYLLPMGGAIWSCPPAQMLAFPAKTFVQFFENHGLLTVTQQPQWYTVTGGSQAYIKPLCAAFENTIRLGCGVVSVTRANGIVSVRDTQGETHTYDHVIFACHANQALAILQEPTPQERSVLKAFTYQKNHAVLHSDASLMPKRRRCWSSWVYHVNGTPGGEPNIGVTYWMNLLQSLDNTTPYFVTLNPAKRIDPALIIDEHDFEHPVFTREAIAAQAKIPSLQGKHNTWFAGAHLRYGFHEDGLLSAVNVARGFGVEVPWTL
jgi:predicted NAD/FAD-binding protein